MKGKDITRSAKKNVTEKKWVLVDAKDKTLGRLAVKIATILRGKDRPDFTPHVDTGDYVVVINASQVKVTGNKREDKMYYRHSGYPGGFRETKFKDLIVKHPDQVIKFAVGGMLPKGRLGRQILSKLKVYRDDKHQHKAQKPESVNL